MVIAETRQAVFLPVLSLSTTGRGEGGFGHTGISSTEGNKK